jgi:hypothetical protein
LRQKRRGLLQGILGIVGGQWDIVKWVRLTIQDVRDIEKDFYDSSYADAKEDECRNKEWPYLKRIL